MSGFIREQNAAGIIPEISSDLVRTIEHSPIPTLLERAAKALSAFSAEHGYGASHRHALYSDKLGIQASTYSASEEELNFLILLLNAQGMVAGSGATGIIVTPAGFVAAEAAATPRSISTQGFVAMWFDPEMDGAYSDGFDRAIRDAGYRPLRIDKKDHADPISDTILAEIRRSKFVIADYTGMNNGVYFEAGFAVGRGIPVIATCRKDYLDRLHFDIRHINTLIWDSPKDLSSNLCRRISAVLGDGPFRTA